MAKTYFSIFITALFVSGCAAPKYTGKPINRYDKLFQITIVKDEATRSIFLNTMETWCLDNGVDYIVVPDGTKHNPNELTLDYVSRWSWDFSLYIANARISAYKNKKNVGYVEFRAPDSLNTDKFGDDEKRIRAMMQMLFGQITEKEVNQKLSSGEL